MGKVEQTEGNEALPISQRCQSPDDWRLHYSVGHTVYVLRLHWFSRGLCSTHIVCVPRDAQFTNEPRPALIHPIKFNFHRPGCRTRSPPFLPLPSVFPHTHVEIDPLNGTDYNTIGPPEIMLSKTPMRGVTLSAIKFDHNIQNHPFHCTYIDSTTLIAYKYELIMFTSV